MIVYYCAVKKTLYDLLDYSKFCMLIISHYNAQSVPLCNTQSHPLYMAVTKYTSTEGQGLDVEEDEIVEVLNAEGSEMWLCQKPEHPEKHGWVPAHYLIAKSEATKLDTRSTQEVFREDVIKITNKQQEAIMKRR